MVYIAKQTNGSLTLLTAQSCACLYRNKFRWFNGAGASGENTDTVVSPPLYYPLS